MSDDTLKTTSAAVAVDTCDNIFDKLNDPMKMFNKAQRAWENISNLGNITEVSFANPIEDIISGFTRTMEVYPPRCMVTYRQ